MSKRVHPGFAAQTGIMSAYLAANNVTAPATIFEAEWGGYYSTYMGDTSQMHNAVDGLGSDFRIRRVGFKPYAACQGIHSSLDIVLGFRREQGVRMNDVARVSVRGSRTHVKQLAKQDAETMLDAQMSLPYSIAAALCSGGAMLDQYTSEALRRAEVRDLARRVTVTHEASVPNGAEPYVDVELKDGRVLTGRKQVARGDYTDPLSEDELREKFRVTAGVVFDATRVAELERTIGRVTELSDMNELVALLANVPQRAARRAAGAGA
jgi:2-methylcitrate dehydratase PrpD